MIYFIAEENTNFVKVGYSSSARGAKSRLSTLQTGNPRNLYIMKIISGKEVDEKFLHEKWKSFSVRGEWFDIKDKLLYEDSIFERIERVISEREKARISHVLKEEHEIESIFALVDMYIASSIKKGHFIMYSGLKDYLLNRKKDKETSVRISRRLFYLVSGKELFKGNHFRDKRFDFEEKATIIKEYNAKKEEERREALKELKNRPHLSESIRNNTIEKVCRYIKENKSTDKKEICFALDINPSYICSLWSNDEIQKEIRNCNKFGETGLYVVRRVQSTTK